MAMARIVMGNRDGAVALRQARSVLTELSAEWPDVNIVQRTLRGTSDAELVQALEREDIGIAVQPLDALTAPLPEGVSLAAVSRRMEARCALIAKGVRDLAGLPDGARIGIASERDRAFLAALNPKLEAELVSGPLDDDLARVVNGDLKGLIAAAATLHVLEQRQRIDMLLEPEQFAPAPGQGALGLLVREDDDLAFELAYTLQHRPSFDRVRAERAFAAGLEGRSVGALATVSGDGEMTLFGAIAENGTTLQATVTGDASEAEQLGRELAQDVQEQVAAI